VAFYRSLGNGCTVEEAWRDGKENVHFKSRDTGRGNAARDAQPEAHDKVNSVPPEDVFVARGDLSGVRLFVLHSVPPLSQTNPPPPPTKWRDIVFATLAASVVALVGGKAIRDCPPVTADAGPLPPPCNEGLCDVTVEGDVVDEADAGIQGVHVIADGYLIHADTDSDGRMKLFFPQVKPHQEANLKFMRKQYETVHQTTLLDPPHVTLSPVRLHKWQSATDD
jgi:hypothetical protein